MSSFAPGVCAWLVVNFDAGFHDPRDVIEADYNGLKLFIKPGQTDSDEADRIAVFMDRPAAMDAYTLRVNRFLSAMAWKDRRGYQTLGASASGCSCENPGPPRFNFIIPRDARSIVLDRFDFEHLVVASSPEQEVALALYRDAMSCSNDFYRFRSFFKIINIRHPNGTAQKGWINAALPRVGPRVYRSRERLSELQAAGRDVGEYLYEQGRCAIAHAGLTTGDPIRDPDLPADQAEIRRDLDLMQELAEIFIEDELGVESVSTI